MSDKTKLSQLKTEFDALQERLQKAAESFQGLIPVTGRPVAAQEAFLLTLSDLKLLQQLFKTAQETFNAIEALQLSPDQESDDLIEALAEGAKHLIEMMVEQFGISQDILMPTIIQDLDRQIRRIKTIIAEVEVSLATAGA